jgi:hypothetical protein
MDWFDEYFVRLALRDGWFRFDEIEFKLKSGRKFRYQMRNYPFKVDASEWELDALACRIIKDKYRYCQWDREHPKTNQEVEIFDAIKEWMLSEVAKARLVRAEDEAAEHAEPDAALDCGES